MNLKWKPGSKGGCVLLVFIDSKTSSLGRDIPAWHYVILH